MIYFRLTRSFGCFATQISIGGCQGWDEGIKSWKFLLALLSVWRQNEYFNIKNWLDLWYRSAMAQAGTPWHRNYWSNIFNRARRNFPLVERLKQWHRKFWCTFWRNLLLVFRHTSPHCCINSHEKVQCFIDFLRWKKTKAKMTFSATYDVKFKSFNLRDITQLTFVDCRKMMQLVSDLASDENFWRWNFPKHKIKSNNFFFPLFT